MLQNKADFKELVDAWWKTARAMNATPDLAEADGFRARWHAHVFENILEQCGWTVDEWNETVNNVKQSD